LRKINPLRHDDTFDKQTFEVTVIKDEIESLQTWLEGAVDAIYHTADLEILHDCLEELCARLDVAMPKTEMLITKK
jgi:hypothetical protein